MPNPLAVDQLAHTVLECVCAALDQAAADMAELGYLDHPGCPCRVAVVPGAAVADDCCDTCPDPAGAGGTLYVSVGPVYPTDPFPQRVFTLRDPCSPAGQDIAVDLTVSLWRCTPSVNTLGRAPTPTELDAAARTHHVDGWAMFRGVQCCLQNLPGRRRGGPLFLMQSLDPIAPGPGQTGGGCQGWAQKATVALGDRCRCPQDVESS